MARLKEQAITRIGEILLFDPEKIKERPGYNSRNLESPEVQAYIRQMADAIKEKGTASFPPISIRQENGEIYVIAGYCRRRAHVLAKSEGAPVEGIRAYALPEGIKGEVDLTFDLLDSNDQLPLTPMEKALAVQRLISFDWTVEKIAKRRGCSAQTIKNMLSYLDLPAEVADYVDKGKVAVTMATETLKERGTIFGGEDIKTAVKTAEAAGKKKATKKHLPKPSVKTRNKSVPDLYDEILNAVTTKFPKETRHETALRYIREAEEKIEASAKQS